MTSVSLLAFAPYANAQEDDGEPEQPPGYEAPETPEIDANAPGLMLSDGAALADPEVLDIKFVTEDMGGQEDTGSGGNGSSGGGGTEDPGGEEQPDDGGDGGTREEYTSGQYKFTLQTDVLFAEGSDVISEEARDSLAEVAAAIDQYHPPEVNIFGFTDDQGSYESGRALSESRAQNTYEALQELIESPEGILFNVRGYSEDFPLYDNNTEEGRQRNRRVEVSWPTEE
ncbi:OmpA family protein [Streptomyces sp. 6N223]|uniref:OmpA family protein n=1 Tax=Streptomyces sp. 6N223 TaxID=3457412 RepID=UPI003FD64119